MSSRWTEYAAIAALLFAVGFVFYMSPRPSGRMPVDVGAPLPELTAVEGWTNVPDEPDAVGAPSALEDADLLVVDCWATWCQPCRAEMPRLAKIAAQYEPLGVAFVGLTGETERDLPAIEKFIGQIDGFDWPVGYGADPVLAGLQIRAIPTVIVFDASRRAVWSSHSTDGLADALDRLLAQ